MATGLISDGPIADRVVLLFRQELAAALASVDATENAIPGAPVEAIFVTEVPDANDIQPLYEEAPESGNTRIAVIPAAARKERIFQLYGAGTGQAQRDEDFEFDIDVRSTANAPDPTRAYRSASRVTTAIISILMRYPDLRVPVGPLAPGGLTGLLFHLSIGQTDRPRAAEGEAMDLTSIIIPCIARVRRVVGVW